MDNASGGTGSGSTLGESLRVGFVLDQVAQPEEEITDIDAGPVEVEKTLKKNRNGDNGTTQQEPHERPAFCNQIHKRDGVSAKITGNKCVTHDVRPAKQLVPGEGLQK